MQKQIQHLESQVQQNPNNPKINLNLGKLYFQLARSGKKEYLKKAEKQFSKVIKLQPDNNTALCWSGCVVVIKAKYAWFPPLKGYYVIAGLKKMDKAVKMSPDNIENRQIRGQTCLQIPTMFNRIDTAIEDFDKLYSLVKQTPDRFNADERAQIVYNLGKAYKIKGNEELSQKYFKIVRSQYSNSSL